MPYTHIIGVIISSWFDHRTIYSTTWNGHQENKKRGKEKREASEEVMKNEVKGIKDQNKNYVSEERLTDKIKSYGKNASNSNLTLRIKKARLKRRNKPGNETEERSG